MSHQEQASRVQMQLNEEESKNSKLLQQMSKLEEQITVMSQESDRKDEVEPPHLLLLKCKAFKKMLKCLFVFKLIKQLSTEKTDSGKDQLTMQETISNLQQSLQSEQQTTEGQNDISPVCLILLFLTMGYTS